MSPAAKKAVKAKPAPKTAKSAAKPAAKAPAKAAKAAAKPAAPKAARKPAAPASRTPPAKAVAGATTKSPASLAAKTTPARAAAPARIVSPGPSTAAAPARAASPRPVVTPTARPASPVPRSPAPVAVRPSKPAPVTGPITVVPKPAAPRAVAVEAPAAPSGPARIDPNGAVQSTNLPFKVFRKGKVRDVYDLGSTLLMVASDRISAFDVVLSPGIPTKGACLTSMSNFWFDHLSDMVPNHLVETDAKRFPKELKPYASLLAGRAVIVEKLTPLPVECVARGYLTGGGLKEYKAKGSVSGVKLPAGLVDGSRLPSPIFTPSTKAEVGHDENISFAEVERLVGKKTAKALRDLTLGLYKKASAYALTRGIIIADTKFEFGTRADGTIVLMDEILTPDSSRFWPQDGYTPGQPQPSFDKQYLRDWLETQPWDKTPPGPLLPGKVVEGTAKRYHEAFERLTGRPFKL